MMVGCAMTGFTVGGCVLDALAGGLPRVAYSLRRLTASYKGKCINVRRSSDNSAMDIGFVGNLLDVATLMLFCGGGSGYVTTWYNQGAGGSACNATQFGGAYDPRIVNSGVLETKNGVPNLNFAENATSFLDISASNFPAGMASFALNFVGYYEPSGTGSIVPYLVGGAAAGSYQFLNFPYNTSVVTFTDNASGVITGGTVTNGVPWIITAMGGANMALYQNGSLIGTSTSIVALGSALARLGQNLGSAYWQGGMQEVIQTVVAISGADQKTLENNQEAYYGISGV